MNTTASRKSVWMGTRIRDVYSPELSERLQKHAGLSTDVIVTPELLRNDPSYCKDTLYIFTTWGMPAFTKEEIAAYFPSLRAVFYAAGSVQKFARPFLESGIAVFSAWAANGVPVAEYTVSQILLATKGYFRSERIFRTEKSKKKAAAIAKHYPGNYGTVIGLVGCGMIGSMVAERLKAYSLSVLVYDPFLSEEKAARLGVSCCSLEELFSRSTVVSNHLANLPATVGMMQYRHFISMPENATFLNTGRGAQLVEPDLIRALTERPDLTAVLDVTSPEPPVPDSPFYTLENVFLTPHIAGSLGLEVHRMSEYMEEEFLSFDAGLPTRYGVTLQMLETMA